MLEHLAAQMMNQEVGNGNKRNDTIAVRAI